jgi:hypothetical protein
MAIYIITIQDNFFGEFTGEFEAENLEEACREAKEEYAYELDTTIDEIEILSATIKQS